MDDQAQKIAEKKQSLKRYKNMLACIRRLEYKLLTLTNKIESARGSNYSGMPRGGTPITIDEMMSDKMELEDRIARLRKKKGSIRRAILDEIDSLEDDRYCDILEGLFIDCLSPDKLAEDRGYTRRHVDRLYKEAVETLALREQ